MLLHYGKMYKQGSKHMTALSSVVAEQFSLPTNLSLGEEEMGLGIVATSLRHLWHRGNGKLRPQK